jgi:hypothetical protein
MQHSKRQILVEKDSPSLKDKSLDFITIGVGCNCLVTLSETGVLNALLDNGYISTAELKFFGDTICIASALITLEKCDVIKKEGDNFYVTAFGRSLSEHIGLIVMFFDGYANLISQQGQIAQNGKRNEKKLVNGMAVSKASTLISDKMIDPIIINEILEVNLSGTVCDLGCGNATMLSKICEKTGKAGLGFDSEPKVVEQARKRLKKTNITVELGNISKLRGIWEDVVILMQCHVFHDFTPEENCIDIINSYLYTFPNMKCFFYLDTVAPSPARNKIFPGFDYVHGLLGIPTRTYEETLKMFSNSMYKVIKEVSLELPNTFLWLLSPRKKEI